jgi:hypothetical protein
MSRPAFTLEDLILLQSAAKVAKRHLLKALKPDESAKLARAIRRAHSVIK